MLKQEVVHGDTHTSSARLMMSPVMLLESHCADKVKHDSRESKILLGTKTNKQKTLVVSFKSSGVRGRSKGSVRIDESLRFKRNGRLRCCSEVLQVLLDPPQGVGAPPQLLHLLLVQSHVDHAGNATAVQHAGQREEHLLVDAVHVLQRCGTMKTSQTEQPIAVCIYSFY